MPLYCAHREELDMPCTPSDFRRVALSLPETEERKHMNHPDFRVAGKIFATLAYPNKDWGMVKLTPIQQEEFVQSHPTVFNPCNGALGPPGRDQCPALKSQQARPPPSHPHGLAQPRSFRERA